jgi:hypothetical protein
MIWGHLWKSGIDIYPVLDECINVNVTTTCPRQLWGSLPDLRGVGSWELGVGEDEKAGKYFPAYSD